MTKFCKRALARIAGVAVIMQANAAVGAEVNLVVLQIHGALAAG